MASDKGNDSGPAAYRGLNPMAIQYTQNEVERELRDILKHGDIRELSVLTGLGESYLSQQLNPDDERVSYVYRFLQIQCAIDEIDPERGDIFFEALKRFRDQSRIRRPVDLCSTRETSRLLTEHSEFIDARLTGKSLSEQLRELDDLKRQIGLVKQSLVGEYIKAKEKTNADTRCN